MDASRKTPKEFVKKNGGVIDIVGIDRNVTGRRKVEDARKESEEHARIFASYQHAVSELRQFYATQAGLEQMLQKTVDLFVNSFDYYMAWYGELKSDEKVIIPRVWAGKYEEYLDGLRLELDDSKDAKCAMSLAIASRKPFGYADLEHDKDFEKWRPLALKYGYRSNQAIPLVIDGKSVGAFLVYSTRPRAFSEHLIRYLAGIVKELATIVENITERRKAQEALKESEEKYRSIFNTAASLITLVDGNGIIVDCNARIEDLLGYKKDEVARQSIAKIIHPDYMQQARACLNEILVNGFARHKEYRMVRKDSKIIDVEINAAGVKDREGKYVGGICIIQDITERKEAERALKKRTEELTIINEMAMELAVVSSTADIYKLACEKLRTITGGLLTCITDYDSRKQEFKVEHISADSELIVKAGKIVGRKIEGLRVSLELCYIEQMLSEKAKRLEGLGELMFGTIPKAVANTLKETLRIGDVYRLVLHYGGKIIGTMLILMPQQKPLVSIEMLKAFANLVATSLKRMKAEEERVAAVQERAAVVDVMSDALIVLNVNGEIISCNPAQLKMFGRSPEDEILGRHFSELREAFCDPQKDIPMLLGAFKGLIRTGLSEPVEVRIRRADGKELTVSALGSLQRDAMGNPFNIVVILRDITAQKRLQKMEKEAALTRMAVEVIEGMLEAVTIMDLDGIIRQVNSEFERGTGWKRQEVVGKTAIELGIMSGEDGHRVEKEIIPKLMNEGFVRNIELVAICRDGTEFPALMSWRLMKDAQGNPKTIIATATDITEHKKAEEKIKLFSEAIAGAIDAIAITDILGNITYANPAKEKMYGYEKGELAGKHVSVLNPKPQIVEEMTSTLMKTGGWKGEVLQQKKNGETFPAWLSLSMIKDEKGNPIATMGAIRDITEQKQAEKKLLTYQKQLRSLASRLSVAEERERRRLATELHDHIGQLLVFSKMKLDGFCSSMASTDPGKSLKEISDMLEQAIDDIQNIIYNLGSPILYELGLEAAIKEWLTAEIEEKYDIATVFAEDGASKPLSDDVSAFVLRAVRELTVNVVKHAHAQNLKVSLQREADRIRICVADDGIGFELSDTYLSKSTRSGFGLFSIKEHLSNIGGDLEIKSGPGRGTQAVLRVPLVEKIP